MSSRDNRTKMVLLALLIDIYTVMVLEMFVLSTFAAPITQIRALKVNVMLPSLRQ